MSDYRIISELHEGMEIARKDGTWVTVKAVDRTDGNHVIVDLADGKFVVAGSHQTVRCRVTETPLIKAARSL
jgi:hypothetical protein